MPEGTQTIKEVTDDQIELKINDLNQKADRTEDETKELDGLKGEKQTRVQKRIDQLTWKAKDAEERFGQASKEADELRTKINDLEGKVNAQPPTVAKKETIDIDGKSFYSTSTLRSMVTAGELTEAEAYTHDQERVEASAADKAYKRFKAEQAESEGQDARKKDADEVFSKYPHFSKDHPDFNPNDPLYVEATKIWGDGYKSDPRGLTKSIQLARRVLRMDDKNPDLSDDFSVRSPSAPRSPEKKTEVTFTPDEEDAAERMYCIGNLTNPKTGKPYTRTEAIAKAKKAKESRRIQ